MRIKMTMSVRLASVAYQALKSLAKHYEDHATKFPRSEFNWSAEVAQLRADAESFREAMDASEHLFEGDQVK